MKVGDTLIRRHQTAATPSGEVRRILYSHEGMHFSLLRRVDAAHDFEGDDMNLDDDVSAGASSSAASGGGAGSGGGSDVASSLGLDDDVSVGTSSSAASGGGAGSGEKRVEPPQMIGKRKNPLYYMPRIMQSIEDGLSYTQIGVAEGIPYQTVRRWCRKAGLSSQSSKSGKASKAPASKKRKKPTGEEVQPIWRKAGKRMIPEEKDHVKPLVQKARQKGYSLADIKIMYGIPNSVASKWCTGIKTDAEKLREERESAIRAFHMPGMTPMQMYTLHGEELGMEYGQVRSMMLRLGLQARLSEPEQKIRDQRICSFRNKGPWLGVAKIAEEFKCSAHIVRTALKSAGIFGVFSEEDDIKTRDYILQQRDAGVSSTELKHIMGNKLYSRIINKYGIKFKGFTGRERNADGIFAAGKKRQRRK